MTRAETLNAEMTERRLENLKEDFDISRADVLATIELIDVFRDKICRCDNLIRSEVVDGALQVISGKLRMALNDF
jgi:hypothetical protein